MPSVDRLLDRRVAVAHQRLDIAGDRDRAAGVLDQLPLGVVERAAMDVGGVVLEPLLGVELFQERAAAELADADMDGDAGADVARGLELRQGRFGRAAKGRQIERDELVVAGEILLAQPRDVAGIFGGRDLHDPAGLVLAGAIGEHRPHARVLQSLDAGVGVRGRILDVRPVEHAGHAGVDRAERADVVGGIDVVRASSWRRTCAARRCGSLRASRPAARCAGSPATCAGGCRRSPA